MQEHVERIKKGGKLVKLLEENFEENIPELIIVFLARKSPTDDSEFFLEELVKVLNKEPWPLLERILLTLLWNDIMKPPTMFAGYSYRSFDGSDYSRLRLDSSTLGMAGTQYARSARIQNLPSQTPPTAEAIFDSILERSTFKAHPSGISATLFYLATIITHDLFNTDPRDPTINRNSSYIDLTPLYGNSKINERQQPVRTFKDGLLKPDTFADSRILLQPPGVGAMLILFSRNHNYIAGELLKKNPDRFNNSDEDLFQTARLINCGYLLKIVLLNYVRTILGVDTTKSSWYLDPTKPYEKSWLLPELPTGVGNQVSLEFNFIYRWHPAIAEKDAEWAEDEFKRLGITPESTIDEFKEKVRNWATTLNEDPSKWTFNGMTRDEEGKFPNNKIAKEIINGTEKVAGAFGANGIPRILRVIEVYGIESARTLGVCSLNDFRRFLKLKPYDSIEDMMGNPSDLTVVNKLKSLYGGSIENVELYPGLMSEKTKPGANIGSMIALPYTVSRAILSDAVNLVRNDRFCTDDFNQHNLAYWDWNILENPESKKLASGGVIHQLILKHLPGIYSNNSSWALYPFVTSSNIRNYLKDRDDLVGLNYTKPQD
ncbi:10016_t:CDS:2 [Diversispora eburnea]|uniref:10016_t:CDS:1 n=1 Tax=Diversispora eburnea TaxID=1213867 RepID=A0A9N8ZM15_9GLOM|nr:10016_t:CDS:2 [Diversispora eburnea]